MKSILRFIVFIGCFCACDSDDMQDQLNKITSEMNVITTPESLVFESSDSIPIVIDCTYKDSALCCGGGEIKCVIDEKLDIERTYIDSTYAYLHCACGDTIYLKQLSEGTHTVSGNFSWNAGDWTYGKQWERNVKIFPAKK